MVLMWAILEAYNVAMFLGGQPLGLGIIMAFFSKGRIIYFVFLVDFDRTH